MLPICSSTEADWLPTTLDALKYSGAGIVTDVLSPELLERIRAGILQLSG